MFDVISPCVTFNNHDGSTKSYKYAKDHEELLHEISFVPFFEQITVDYAEGEGLVISLDLKSVSAYEQQRVDDAFLDLDASANPFLYQRTVRPQQQRQWSQEIQGVASALDERLRLTAGVYGFWRTRAAATC